MERIPFQAYCISLFRVTGTSFLNEVVASGNPHDPQLSCPLLVDVSTKALLDKVSDDM